MQTSMKRGILSDPFSVISCSENAGTLILKRVIGSLVKQQEITKTIYSLTSFMEFHK